MSKLFATHVFNPLFNVFIQEYLSCIQFSDFENRQQSIQKIKANLFLNDIEITKHELSLQHYQKLTYEEIFVDSGAFVENQAKLKRLEDVKNLNFLFNDLKIAQFHDEIKNVLNQIQLPSDIINLIIFPYCEISVEFYQNLFLQAAQNDQLSIISTIFNNNNEYNFDNQSEIFHNLNDTKFNPVASDAEHYVDSAKCCQIAIEFINSIPRECLKFADNLFDNYNENKNNEHLSLGQSELSFNQPKSIYSKFISYLQEEQQMNENNQQSNEKKLRKFEEESRNPKIGRISGSDVLRIFDKLICCIFNEKILKIVLPSQYYLLAQTIIHTIQRVTDAKSRKHLVETMLYVIKQSKEKVQKIWKLDEKAINCLWSLVEYYSDILNDYLIHPELAKEKLQSMEDVGILVKNLKRDILTRLNTKD